MSRMDLPMQSWTPVPQVVARKIQKMILNGDLAAGERIPSQRLLSERFNVSRASLREALLTLETLGLIRTEPGRGTFVADGKPQGSETKLKWRYSDSFAMRDVFETRLMLESQIARHATALITAEALSALTSATDTMESCWNTGDVLANVEADVLFHRTLADSCANQMLILLYDTVQSLLAETQRLPIPRTHPNRMRASIGEHRDIIAALIGRDASVVEAAMIRHIRNTAECGGISV